MASNEVILAVDVGGSKVAAGLFTPNLEMVESRLTPTRNSTAGLADSELRITYSLIRQLVDFAETRDLSIASACIGLPEYVSADGTVTSRECIDWRVQPKEELPTIVECRWVVESDVRCAAVAEARLGAGAGAESVLYVTSSTGISSCLVINGVPWSGAHGSAIGLGTLPLSLEAPNGDTVETVGSGLGLARVYNQNSSTPALDAKEVNIRAEAIEFPDPIAGIVLDRAGKLLGGALASAVEIIDPSVLVIGGSLYEGSARYRSAAETAFAHLHHRPAARPEIRLATLGPNRGLLGATLLASG